jgi:anti-sigma B factor antagonist
MKANPNPMESPSSLSISERQMGDVTVLDLEGNVIMGGGSARLRETLQRLKGEGREKILLNLARVKYMDSSGVGELLAGLKSLGEGHGHLKLLNPPERVEQVLALSSVLGMFEVYTDESRAVNEFE